MERSALELLWLLWSSERKDEPDYSALYSVLDDCIQRSESILHNANVHHGLRGNTIQLALMQTFLVGRIEAMVSMLPYIEKPETKEGFEHEWRSYQNCLRDVMNAFKKENGNG